MPSSIEARPLTSAFESPTFGEDSSFHVEQPVGSMSISPCGRDVVLASKEGLHVIDLDSPYSPPRYLPHHTPWEVADVQWSPFAARDYWVASTSNQKALVWNLAMKTGENSIEHVLHAHSRAITDINFSAHHPDLLATCSVDSFVHGWDLRTPSRPVVSFSDWFAGATQVKWNRQDSHVIASSHDKFLRIWDNRMGAYPIKSIEAHSTKIYGVDWNRVRSGALLTCSLDKTIKFWDYTVEGDVPEKIIRAPFPVWRARNTPFGWGVLAMPQRGNSDLHLYSRRAGEGTNHEENLPLVHSFPGHKGQVKEFLWRARGGVEDGIDHREFQLVSWGTDRELRLHRVDPDILQRVGYEKGKSFISTLNVTRRGAVYKTFRDESGDQEFDDVEPALSRTPNISRGGIGMNTISVPYGRAWTQGGNVDSRVGMQGRSNFRADTNPISWMRGVKISGWDIETLGDEITHVGEKFTKVVFESVDIRQRKATISLHGPWGTDGDSLFLKVDIKFPTDYPRASVPTFSIQKTVAVTDQLASKIISELRTIAETYLSRKRGCLEGVVRYLLGECTMEESIAWILGETTETVRSPVNGDMVGEESSDEDEVGMSQSQDLGMSSELLRPINANVMVPVARGCGAFWANNGRLVCFFPPKKDKSVSFLENLGLKEITRLSREDKVFEGFGRIQTSSPGPRMTSTLASTDDGASDYSDDSYAESSSSSGSSAILSGLQTRLPGPQTWRSAGSLGLHRLRSTDNSQRSIAGALTNRTSDVQHNVISIHNLSHLLPAKRELASSYRICGKGADVCAHNAAVAFDAGYHDLARIWGLVRQILHDQASLELSPRPNLFEQRQFAQIRRKDSAVDLSYDLRNQDQCPKAPANSVIQWGNHPFGGRWLIPALFDHFERIGDVQMVAMLSCVLHQSNYRAKSITRRREQQRFSPDFYSTGSLAQNKPSQAVTPLVSTPKDSHTTPVTHSSGRSSTELWRVDSTSPYSTGTTPPFASRSGKSIPSTTSFAERKSLSQNVSIAASPEQQSHLRSGPGFGSTLASSLSRSFTFGPSSASPPVSALNRRKPSLSGSPNTTAGSVWTSGIKAVDSMTTSTAPTSHTHSDSGSEQLQQPKKAAVRFKVTIKNQDRFDNDGYSYNPSFGIPFLDPKKDRLYRSYRAAYAEMLAIWSLPVQQSEVRKIGGLLDYSADMQLGHWSRRASRESFSLSPPGRRNSQPAAPKSDNEALDIQRHCTRCGHALQLSIFSTSTPAQLTTKQAKTVSWTARCPKCKPKQPLPTRPSCVICGEVVEGMLVPCLSCGHVSCFECHRQWFWDGSDPPRDGNDAPDDNHSSEEGSKFCPTGCGCNCSEHMAAEVAIPWNLLPSRQESETSSGHTGHSSQSKSRSRRPGTASTSDRSSKADPAEDLKGWHTSSTFASLARGLGGGLSRGLRPEEDKRRSRTGTANVSSNRKSSGRRTK